MSYATLRNNIYIYDSATMSLNMLILLIVIIFLIVAFWYCYTNVGSYLYRVLRLDENPAVGLVAKDRLGLAQKTVLSHVNCGSRPGYISQFISTSATLAAAICFKALGELKGQTGMRIARIEKKYLPASCQVYDLTSKENRDMYLGNSDRIKNFANKYKEVLLTCPVPIPFVIIG